MNQSLFHHSKQQEYCPQCGAPLQIKQGKKGLFLGCSAYPECDFVVREESESEEKITCPECKTGHLISRRGRQGKIFYGCDNFPKCKFSLPAKPYTVPCPMCHFPLSLLKVEDGEKQIFQCANKTCRYIFEQ